MALIYYADDEQEIREIVSAFLKNDGYQVRAFETGDLLLEAFHREPCDLVLLDLMMPGTDGMGVLAALRKSSRVPIILLTAKDTDSDYYSGLTLGSDDYIVKPFKPVILLAKIHALLRRVQFEKEEKAEKTQKDLRCGNLTYSWKKREFRAGERLLPLTPTEMRFLEYLMLHFQEAVSKETLLDEVWGLGRDLESRVADETNRRLRRKLTEAQADVYVQTVWGYGFKLTEKNEGV